MNSVYKTILKCNEIDSLNYDEEVEKLAQNITWECVLRQSLDILSNIEYKEHWYIAASIISWAAEDQINFPEGKENIVARLYWCLEKHPKLGEEILDGENLVWSTTSVLYNISYTSSWDPKEERKIKNLIKTYEKANKRT